MPKSSSEVGEFRGVVEERAPFAARPNDFRSGSRKETNIYGATYVTLDPGEKRLSAFPDVDGRLWAVGKEKLRVASLHRIADLAIFSSVDDPDNLFKRWTIRAGSEIFDSTTELTTSEAQAAVSWARYPADVGGSFAVFAAISSEEVEKLTPDLELADEEYRRMRVVVDRMSNNLDERLREREDARAMTHRTLPFLTTLPTSTHNREPR